MDSRNIQISLVSNAGVLLQIGSVNILLDAVWADSESYSSPPACICKQMLYGPTDSKWRNADYLIYTHLHNDHFSQHKAIEYLQHNSVHSVWFELPNSLDANIEDSTILRNYLAASKVAHRQFGLQQGTYQRLNLTEDIALTAICTQHMGINAHQNHIALAVHSGDKNILFVTDAEFPLPLFKEALYGIQLDAIFLNPVHFYSRRAVNFAVEELAAKLLVAYHIPFAGEGNSVFRRMISRKLPIVEQLVPVQLLWNIGDCLTI